VNRRLSSLAISAATSRVIPARSNPAAPADAGADLRFALRCCALGFKRALLRFATRAAVGA
jgi:hypothetical protein